MAKKSIDIQKIIEAESIPFRNHIEKVLNSESLYFIRELCKKYDVYIFSGIIRNYFLKIDEIRDIDLVIDGGDTIEPLLEKYSYIKNSFGGYKIQIDNLNIDLWFLKDTWALNFQKVLYSEIAKYELPKTSFFNFSSVVYSLKENKFIYTKYFIGFLRDKKINLVYKPNPNDALCIVNSFYYADKLKLKLSDKLIRYLKVIYKNDSKIYEDAQIKHFGKVLYTNDEINKRITNL